MEAKSLILEGLADLKRSSVQNIIERAAFFQNFHAPQYHGKTLATYFSEASTRTKLSFHAAAQNLGLKLLDLRPETSSSLKGESFTETLKTIGCLGADLIVLRTKEENLYSKIKQENFSFSVLNGGSGTKHHPTQALLDYFCLKQSFPQTKKILFVGDTKHSRVFHSLYELLKQENYSCQICSPKNFASPIIEDHEYVENLSCAISEHQLLYVLRPQLERHEQALAIADYKEKYQINSQVLDMNKQLKAIYHPGPVTIDLELTKTVMKSSLYKGYQQVENGVFVRMAIIEYYLQKMRQV